MASKKQESLDIFVALLKDEVPSHPIHAEHESYLLMWCSEHGVGGYLHKHKDKYFSKDFAMFLATAYKVNVQKNLIFLQEFENLRGLCADLKLPSPVALKGLALLQRVHPLGERPLTDMDVYLPHETRQQFKDIARENGFTLVPEKKWHANSHKATYTKNIAGLEITLETHDKLFYNQPEDFTPATISNGNMRILAPELELVYLSAHLVHQHTFLKLFWLMDLHQLTKKNPVLWNEFTWELAHTLRVKTSLAAVGFCLRSLLGHNIAIQSKFLPMKYFLNWNTLILLNERRIKYLLMKHASKDSLGESLVYDFKWLYFRMENALFTKSKNNENPL